MKQHIHRTVPGEDVVIATRMSFILAAGPPAIIIGFGTFGLVFLAMSLGTPIAELFFVASVITAALLSLRNLLRWATTEAVLTTHRIIVKQGLIKRTHLDSFLHRVQGVRVEQSLIGRIFGFGTLVLEGWGDQVAACHGVADPQRFRKAMIAIVSDAVWPDRNWTR